MAEREEAIEVRTLSGEKITVEISPNKTVHELKLLLNLIFTPASTSPNFHLFFKGIKLRLQSRLSTHSIEPGEFFVLIPFTKKDRPQTPEPNSIPNESSVSSFADSAYSEMMQEFSFLRAKPTTDYNNSNQPSDTSHFGVLNNGTAAFDAKPQRVRDGDEDEGSQHRFLWSFLQSPNENFTDEETCEKFVAFLDSVNCLSDPRLGKCMLLSEDNLGRGVRGVCTDEQSSCLCPAWLKRIMAAFAFLSIFAASIELQRGKLTLSRLKEVLNQLGKFGVKVSIEDIEHLSVLCPKVVCFVDNAIEPASFRDALAIIKYSKGGGDEVERNRSTGQKDMSLSKIFSAMKKRERSFKSNLWQAVKLLTKSGNASLENLLITTKEGGTVAQGNEAKRVRRSWSSASSSRSDPKKCYDTGQLLPAEMLIHLRKGIGSRGQMVHVEDIGARQAVHAEIPNELSDNTKSALKCIGITKLYCHQAEAIVASIAGKNVIVATLTSSGKSLCYNVPVLEALSQNLSSCALYLFPTKALAQDQLRALKAMTEQYDVSVDIGVYDGDTSQIDRMWLRDNARLLITNPDMLNKSILPMHGQFSRILSNLRFVVIDETHVYKGAFGCHTALILRRLRRLCSHVYGTDPSFIFSTATSANPQEHCMELANLSTIELFKNDGSPSSHKLFVLWNPSLCQESVSSEDQRNLKKSYRKSSSPILEVSYLFAEMMQHGLRCIAFCRSRKLCELVLCYTREILEETAPHMVNSISAYRGGYTAKDRRRIEEEFFSGKLCGIAATNALELGIDVGHIDVTLHLGFPGSIASLWQQAGRSGRRERPSLAVYVAFEGPLDQYFMKFPEKLFRSPIECCHIDAQNQQVLEQHLVCASLEHPLSLMYDEKYFGSGLNNAIMSLENRGYLSYDRSCDPSARTWSYIGHEKRPSHTINIRAIETVQYKVIDMRKDEVLEEIEESRAFFQVYEGAVYLHQGDTYLVKDLNISSKIALCQKADLKYYTKTRDYTDIHVIGGNIAYPARTSKNFLTRTTAQAHNCKVTTTWFGFRKIWRGSNEVFDTVELSLPKYSYESQAVWIEVSQLVKTEVEKNYSFRAGLHAACHALLHVAPLYVRCNSSDLAPECPNPYDARYFPARILLYDQHPGGTGVSTQIQPYFTELLTAALELLTCCHCSAETGCPNCVQNIACPEYNELIHKEAAIMIIKGVLDAEKSYFGGLSDSS
ncbi:DEAD domain-containing protein/Helicase_C domain-containing protein/DUF1998 domain-containing protein [Cephalotus follicularis]|uniref:DEAD domain-containing protein/Helicase_C domain-containing protein/DUF1998 domain-containing protein n=1 Tax=Cephalotus follicularis TaxID=3775 RepID=A0A1Q3CBZ2_CEPFO|nr:DEAD domain-containing protein/Helicase_C domain-containing protein/DUF1998 domain-containing protein [Cephalotus follicularis]